MSGLLELRHEAIVSQYLAGATIAEVAALHGRTGESVRKILHRADAMRKPAVLADPLYPRRALLVAARLAGCTVEQLVSPWRERPLVRARFAVMACLRRRGVSTPQIGRRLNRTAWAVSHGLKQAAYLAERDPEFARMLAEVDAA